MKLEQAFTVTAPIDQVWAMLTDIERVAPCLPGAEIKEKRDDGSYAGAFKVKLGPTSAVYEGALRFDSLDPEERIAAMSAEGQDRRGQGGVTAKILSRLSEEDGVTEVHLDSDITITGRLARFGRTGIIADVSDRLMHDFADSLQAEIVDFDAAAPDQGAPGPQPRSSRSISGFGLLFRALWHRLTGGRRGRSSA